MSDAPLEAAVADAARLLARCRAPVIAGLATDVAGIVAAYRLAERIGAAVDHRSAEAALVEQAVLQSTGLMLVSPSEARRRADTVLLVGDRPAEAWPELSKTLLAARPDGGARKIVALTAREPNGAAAWLGGDAASLPARIAALRARVGGRPLAEGYAQAAEAGRVAALLKEAAFGVAIWSPDEIDALTLELLTGLVKDLNDATRWSGLSVPADEMLAVAATASGWMSALPLRARFVGGRPVHDPWAFDAARMVRAGEADGGIWISGGGAPAPDWLAAVPIVALAPASEPAPGAAVMLPVGRPGIDHDGIVFDRRTGTLAEAVATARSNLPSVAEALTLIAARLAPP